MLSKHLNCIVFQSTPPVKAATAQHEVFAELVAISIHAAREGGDFQQRKGFVGLCISIHAAREGGDPGAFLIGRMMPNFNPRRP